MPPTNRSPNPNGSVGVEPIASSAQNGAVDLINQSRSRSVGVLEHESESCATPDGEPETINKSHRRRHRADSLSTEIRKVLVCEDGLDRLHSILKLCCLIIFHFL